MVNEAIQKFLRENSYNNFFASLLRQFERYGNLSPRQLECVERAMNKVARIPVSPNTPRVFTLAVGSQIEIKRGTANRLKAEKKLNIFFRNLEIVEVLDETLKAYKVNVRFVSSVCTNCHCCGKPLDTEVSRSSGIGPVCIKKYFGVKRPTEETAQKILALLDKYCLEVGVVEAVWIPKSQIISRKAQAHSPDSPIVAVRTLDDMLGTTREADITTTREIWERAQKDSQEK